MNIETVYCDNYFPPTSIMVKKYKDGTYLNETTYLVPEDGIYQKQVVGLWHVKYKKLDPNYYCDGQKHLIN
jgi:hypothetical protein